MTQRTNGERQAFRDGFVNAMLTAQRWQAQGKTFEEFVEWMEVTAALSRELADLDAEPLQ